MMMMAMGIVDDGGRDYRDIDRRRRDNRVEFSEYVDAGTRNVYLSADDIILEETKWWSEVDAKSKSSMDA